MRRSTLLAATCAMALGLGAGSALAQTAPTLRIGGQVDATLTDQDATDPDGGFRYEDYRFTARAGQRLEAVMRSDVFDSYLEIYADGAEGQPLASDDDGLGEGLNSRLRFTPERAGTYVLRARTLSGLEGGAYSLSLAQRAAPPRLPRPTSIRVGQTLRGSLGARDPETEEGVRFDHFSFRGAAGDRFTIALDSEAFDPVVSVGRMADGEFAELAYNDDFADTLNARLVFTLPTAGEYVIRATALGGEGGGDYTLSLLEGPPPVEAAPIAIGDTVEGELDEGDALNETGSRADAYRFTGTAGQRVRIGVSSDDFDTYLQLFQDANGVRTALVEDDDGAGQGTNSRLTHTLPADGSYVVEVRAFADGGAGAYSLVMSEAPPERAPEALAYGATIQGEIDAEDPTDDQERGFDTYQFDGVEGQRVQVIMRSGDFDAFLAISSADGEFSELASDDDGLGQGTDSRLTFTLPTTGSYVVRASPLVTQSDGLYSIELIDRGPQPVAGSVLVGETARGSLTDTDAMAPDGSFYDAYGFEAKAGETLIFTMVSNSVDAFLIVGRENGGGEIEVLASDDDSLSDTHAKVEWEVPDDGTYVVRAGTFGQAETGPYALTVSRQP